MLASVGRPTFRLNGDPSHAETLTKPKRSKKAAPDDGLTLEQRIERDASRYEALARGHGADLGEEAFSETLKRVSQHRAEPPK